MAIAADKSAAENRWVPFREIVEQIYCVSPTQCDLLSQSDVFPENFRPVSKASDLLLPDVDHQKESSMGSSIKKAFMNIFAGASS
jgi:hypothetical protein